MVRRYSRHGMSHDRFYYVWRSMKHRCYNINCPDYDNYGGRGIVVSKNWHDFNGFYKDMWHLYNDAFLRYNTKISLDRINTNGNYELDNCRWIPFIEQMSNRRNNKWFKAISPEGITYISKNQNRFCKDYRLSVSALNKCLSCKQSNHKGWKFEYIGENYDRDK